jgi:hypothetical protein
MRRATRRVVRLLIVPLTCLAVGLPATPARAALGALPDVTWMTNGQVRATLVSGNYLYIGGKFTQVRQTPPKTPGASFSATNLARIDLATGAGDSTWTPDVTTDVSGSAVYALAAIGDQIWVGGSFTAIDGAPRLNLAAVSATTAIVDPFVHPSVGLTTADRVEALVAGPSMIYAGGFYKVVNDVERLQLAAFHTDGSLDPVWNPKVDKRVFSMALDCTGTTLFAGGQFRRAGGTNSPYETRETIARFNLVTGALDPWAIPVGTIPTGQKAYDMAPTCTRLYAAYGGSNWALSLALDNGSIGNQLWRRNASGNVQAIALAGDRLVIGGHFESLQGGFVRLRIAALMPATGAVDTVWNPGVDGQWGGPWDMAVEANHLWVGGQFTTVAGVAQTFLTRFTF